MTQPARADVSPNENHTVASTTVSLTGDVRALKQRITKGDIDPIARAERCLAILDRHSITRERLGELLGVTGPAVCNWLLVLELDDQDQERVRRGAITATAGATIARAARRRERRQLEPVASGELQSVPLNHFDTYEDAAREQAPRGYRRVVIRDGQWHVVLPPDLTVAVRRLAAQRQVPPEAWVTEAVRHMVARETEKGARR